MYRQSTFPKLLSVYSRQSVRVPLANGYPVAVGVAENVIKVASGSESKGVLAPVGVGRRVVDGIVDPDIVVIP